MPGKLGGAGAWVYEIGDAPSGAGAAGSSGSAGSLSAGGAALISASSLTPIFAARDTTAAWEWRIRNLPYPKEVYSFDVDDPEQKIILRTSNKK